jgi:hypothetical protein
LDPTAVQVPEHVVSTCQQALEVIGRLDGFIGKDDIARFEFQKGIT